MPPNPEIDRQGTSVSVTTLHRTTGFPNNDYVLYYSSIQTSDRLHVGATSCLIPLCLQQHAATIPARLATPGLWKLMSVTVRSSVLVCSEQNGVSRWIVPGYMNFCPLRIETTDVTTKDHLQQLTTGTAVPASGELAVP